MKTNNDVKLWFNHNPQLKNKKAKIYSDGILHQLLNDACPELAPFEIKRGENGKPYVDTDIHFSYSHSRQAYFYGLTSGGLLGVDLEYTGKDRDFMTLARRYFHADEAAKLEALDQQQRRRMFYRLWTRKEAWCKLSGGVLWYYLGRSVLADQVQSNQHKTIYFSDFNQLKGFAAAVASNFVINHVPINVIK